MICCGKCSKISGWIFLVLGIIYLLGDLNIWNFFGISWWTALFIFGGIIALARGKCTDCQSCKVPINNSVKPIKK